MQKLRIIIADDHSLFIDGLRRLLLDENWIEVIDVVNNGKELLDILPKRVVDVVLLDINMPRLNGLEAASHIKKIYPHIKLIILSTYNEDHLIERAKQTGINGYLLKNCNKEELIDTIRLVMNNQTSFPYREPALTGGSEGPEDFIRQFSLTRREMEIIQFLKNGATNKLIADRLFLSVYTVETHRKNIMRKLGLNTPTALMKFIFEQGL